MNNIYFVYTSYVFKKHMYSLYIILYTYFFKIHVKCIVHVFFYKIFLCFIHIIIYFNILNVLYARMPYLLVFLMMFMWQRSNLALMKIHVMMHHMFVLCSNVCFLHCMALIRASSVLCDMNIKFK